ncbi:hypothetical protein Hsw_2224 [Hymenobacter swuensis DY53]|uniref:Uncharacterized protein n=1 Tax=Hymenobacter swuensis DY53 TaxID=1227739 RepID=W8EXJ2_9BACT|nr:hypothetical protein Hsw_2224 [Hymenobacter swuensis DY53]
MNREVFFMTGGGLFGEIIRNRWGLPMMEKDSSFQVAT